MNRYGKGESDKTYLTFCPNPSERATIEGFPILADPDEGVETEAANHSEKVNQAEGGIG